MESVRHQLLQQELKNVEALAEAHSTAVMNQADALEAAWTFCANLNAGIADERDYAQITTTYHLASYRGAVCFLAGSMEISVWLTRAALTRLDALGIAWCEVDEHVTPHPGLLEVEAPELRGVSIYRFDAP